jgi:hypothetical protein
MTDLFEQVTLPHYEYIPPRQRKAQPIERGHWKADRNYRDACPQCGEPKTSTSALCYQCAFSKGRAPVDPVTYWEHGSPYRRVPLMRGEYALVDAEDYERVMRWRWIAPIMPKKDKYHVVTSHCLDESIKPFKYVRLQLQNLVMQCPREILLDHENRNPLDNRKCNIRPCNLFQNAQNKGKFKSNHSGYKGVWKCTHSATYQTCINVNRKKINIGNFATAHEAGFMRDIETVRHHGRFGVLNFPHFIEQILYLVQLEPQNSDSTRENHGDLLFE